jgi:hypothetical protein
VSAFFQSIDFGIALTPWKLIGKSASSAAMLEHGVPVIVSRDDVEYGIVTEAPTNPLLYRLGTDLPDWLRIVRRQPARSRLPEMARCFLSDIDSAAHGQPRPMIKGSMSAA